MSTKRERAEIIERRSREMAMSGGYRDFITIEHALRAQGFEESRGQLDNPAIRQYLNELCAVAQKKTSSF